MRSDLLFVLVPFVWVVAALGVQRTRGQNRALYLAFGALTVALLLGLWLTVVTFETWFTESNLAGYYCCVMDGDLPERGTLARSLSDFFATSPGAFLLPFLVLAGSVALTLRHLHRVAEPVQLLAVVALLTLLYAILSLILAPLAWDVSDAVNGAPRMSPYTGYERTIYGIVLHFLLLAGYFWALARADRIAARQSPLRLRVTD